MNFKKTLLQANLAVVLGLSGGVAFAACTTYIAPNGENTYECNNTNGDEAAVHTPLNGYDNVIINTTADAGFTPLRGFGIYVNNDTWNLNKLNITTSGSAADAIQVNVGNSNVIIDKLYIHATGASADGINITRNSQNGSVTVGNNAIIIADDGMGVRVNTPVTGTGTNQAHIGENASISTAGAGSNLAIGPYEFGSGYGVYAGNTNNNATGKAKLTIGKNSTISTTGSSAHAVFANKGGEIQLGDTTVSTGQSNAYGLYAETGNTANGSKGSTIDLLGSASVAVPTGAYAIYANGAESAITSKNTGKFTVTGDMRANNKGKIDLRMTDNSTFTGNTSITGTGGTLNLNITGANSQWQMSKNSNLTNLTLNGGANVYLGNQSTPINSANRVVLTMQDLSGNNGVFHVRTDIVQSGNESSIDISDMIKVTGTSSGNHKIIVNDHNTGGAAVIGNEIVHVADIADGGARFTLANANGYVDMGAYKYELVEENAHTRANNKFWHLQAQKNGGGGTKPPLTNTADHSVNILNINYLLNHVETQTLLQRMGELRQTDGAQGDVWARAYTGQLDSFADDVLEGFDLDYSGVQIGADKRIDMGNGDLYLGGVVGTAKADANYKVGDGDTESYHAGIYASYKTANGFYIDGIAKYVHMKNSFNTETGGNNPVKGDGNTNGYSIGVEAGQRFYLSTPKTGWYLEPQAQLTYAHQNSTTIGATNTLKTKLDSFDSVLGRASVIVGYTVAKGANPVDVYFKTGYVKEFDGKAGYTFSNTERNSYKFNGNWWDNGLGVNAQINQNHNVYLEADYAIGNKFDRKQLNVGYRYTF